MRMLTMTGTMLVASLSAGCATQALWKATDPDKRVAIAEDKVSEAELRERGVPYRKDDRGVYLVGKTRGERFGDHALRFVLAPAAVCMDIAPYLAVAAAQGFLDDLSARSGGHPLGEPPPARD